MTIENMPCPICDSNDYHDTGDLHSNKSIVICKVCGGVWHKVDPTKEAEMLEFYRKDYRSGPTHMNLVYAQNKIFYLGHFLGEWLKDKKDLVCTDIGCATGYMPNWLRRMGHRATGTEYTTSFRRFAEHFYGVMTTETIEKKHKYDLISFYHTLEHMISPDKKLVEARECLSENGRILVSVPRFFHLYDDPSTLGPVTFDNLFHKNHINAFSLQGIQNLFAKVGLEIEKQDLLLYGMTFLLKKCEPNKAAIVNEPWEDKLKAMELYKKASILFGQGKFKEATEVFPLFPNAWISHIMQTAGKDPVRQQDEWNAVMAIPDMANNNKTIMQYSIWLQAQERYEEAIKSYTRLISIKPSADWFFQRGVCLTIIKDYENAIQDFKRCANMQPLKWAECMDWCAKCASSLNTWEENAVEQVKEEMWKRNKEKIMLKPKDTVMENIK